MTDQTLRATPQQKRAQVTLTKILTAARTVYNDPRIGRDRLTTEQVAKLSGTSIGTVYRYFEDRVAILDTIAPDRDQTPAEIPTEIEA